MKALIIGIVSCFLGISAAALEISIIPLIVSGEDSRVDIAGEEKQTDEIFYNALLKRDSTHRLRFTRLLKDRLVNGKAVQSALDAFELCEANGVDYLLYGYYKKSYAYGEMEVRFFDLEKKGIVKTFYAKAEAGDYEGMIEELAARMVDYFNALLGITGEEKNETEKNKDMEFGGIEIVTGAGYWTPVGKWFGVYTGVFEAGFGIVIQPENIPFELWNAPVFYRYGLLFHYSLGLSKPDIEESYLHTIELSIPLQFGVLLENRHGIYAGVSLYYMQDIIYQVRLFGSPVAATSGALGSAFTLGYEYLCGERRGYSFGTEALCGLSFYENLRITVSLAFQFKYRFDF